MHESAYNEMKWFAESYLNYCSRRELKIIEIGSMDINGSYKPIFDHPKWEYIGLDLEAGKNVDVVAIPYHYPFEDGSFDVVISGSTLEHAEDTHAFIKEATRIMRDGGMICIIAPWAWPEHKHPIDCWRILPDGMKFLLGNVGGLSILNIHKNETDCIGVAAK